MRHLVRTGIFVFGFVYIYSAGASWWFLSSHREMEGYLIDEVGEVFSKHYYDPETLQGLEWFEFKSSRIRCFLFSDGDYHISSHSAAPALLLRKAVGKGISVRLALLEPSFGTLNAEVRSLKFITCPSFYPL